MINVMIDTLQSFIILYIKNNRFYNSYGFVKALKEILVRKFGPAGIQYSNLLVTDPNVAGYFPWETIFDLSAFKDNEYVKDAKGLLKETFEKLRYRELPLKTLQMLIDDSNRINARLQFLVSKVVKVPMSELQVCGTFWSATKAWKCAV